MTRLNDTARETLEEAGITPAEWAQRHFGDCEWFGDACGCTDDRCIGFHHSTEFDCGCLPALLEMGS